MYDIFVFLIVACKGYGYIIERFKAIKKTYGNFKGQKENNKRLFNLDD